jgi:hypothetical protein
MNDANLDSRRPDVPPVHNWNEDAPASTLPSDSSEVPPDQAAGPPRGGTITTSEFELRRSWTTSRYCLVSASAVERPVEQALLLGLDPRNLDAVPLGLDLLLLGDLVVDRLHNSGRRLQISKGKSGAVRDSTPLLRPWAARSGQNRPGCPIAAAILLRCWISLVEY